MPANKAIKRMKSVGVAFGSGAVCGRGFSRDRNAKSSPIKRFPRCVAAIGLMGF